MADKKTLIDFRKEALDSLKVWFAETMEADLITALTASPTYTLHCASGGTAVHTDTAPGGSVATTDTIGAKPISRLVARAKLLNPKIRPIRIGGKDYYVLILHPEAAHELKNQADFMNAAQYAMPRGADNPLFTGALGMWDGCVIHEHDGIPTADDGAASAHYTSNIFMGAQAGIAAFGGDHNWHEETVDRGNKLSVSASVIYEFSKAKFNSKDFATIIYNTATTKLS